MPCPNRPLIRIGPPPGRNDLATDATGSIVRWPKIISRWTLTVINAGRRWVVFAGHRMNRELPPLTIDTRPIFARGETPCQAIDAAVAALAAGQSLELIAPFEPVPLYVKLGRQGFSHEACQADIGDWRVIFRKT